MTRRWSEPAVIAAARRPGVSDPRVLEVVAAVPEVPAAAVRRRAPDRLGGLYGYSDQPGMGGPKLTASARCVFGVAKAGPASAPDLAVIAPGDERLV